jgi:hypothetical protein
VFLGVARPFQPADAAPVEFVDVIKYPVLGIPVFCIFNYRFYTLSEYSDNVYYPQFFIIRTFPEIAVVMRVIR